LTRGAAILQMGLQEWNCIKIDPYRQNMVLNKIFPGRISQQKWSWLSGEMTRIRKFLFTAHFGIHPLLVLTNPFFSPAPGKFKIRGCCFVWCIQGIVPFKSVLRAHT